MNWDQGESFNFYAMVEYGPCTKARIDSWFYLGQWWKQDPSKGPGSPDRTDPKPDYMIIVRDSFDMTYFPVYCSREALRAQVNEYSTREHMSVMEVYDLHFNAQEQIDRVRCWAVPE